MQNQSFNPRLIIYQFQSPSDIFNKIGNLSSKELTLIRGTPLRGQSFGKIYLKLTEKDLTIN